MKRIINRIALLIIGIVFIGCSNNKQSVTPTPDECKKVGLFYIALAKFTQTGSANT